MPTLSAHKFNIISRSSKSRMIPGTRSLSSYHKMSSKKNPKYGHLPLSTSGPLECALTGTILLNNPIFNKGSAFPSDERRDFNLTGLLPQSVQTLEQQANRAYQQFSSAPDDLAKNAFMTSMSAWPPSYTLTTDLKNPSEVLEVLDANWYHRGTKRSSLLQGELSQPSRKSCLQCLSTNSLQLLQDHMDEMFSIIYTPTEGEAIQNFSRLFRRPEGCFLNINDVDRVHHDLAQWGRPEDIDYIVVTDGEEILGIGDQGCGGVLISVAKLVLTTLCAGIHPNRVLPVVLDCGTDNEDLLKDELYLGLRENRVRGEKYDKFVDSFVKAARELYPRAYIHFEDFGLDNGTLNSNPISNFFLP